MGSRGPVPNRSEDLSRPRERRGKEAGPEVTNGTMRPVRIPDADPDWHPIAVMVWESLLDSGQADFYQQSDWAYAYSLMDDITKFKEGGRWNKQTGEFEPYRSPEMLKAIQAGMTALLMTEADRRRARIELQAPEPEKTPASLHAIQDYQAGLGLDDDTETQE